MSDFEKTVRDQFMNNADSMLTHIGFRQIELMEETNKLLRTIVDRMPKFTITPIDVGSSD